jgi:hypothetical protein
MNIHDILRRFYKSINRWILGRPHDSPTIHQQIRLGAIATHRDHCREGG